MHVLEQPSSWDGLSTCETHRLSARLTVKKKLSLARKLLRWSVPSLWLDDTMGIAALHPSYELDMRLS
jgi:hypothetical protein